MGRFSCAEVSMAALGDPAGKRGREVLYHCPRHDDHHPSLQINKAKDIWLCGPCSAGGNPWQLAAFLAGCDASDKIAVKLWLQGHGLATGGTKTKVSSRSKTEIACYSYTDTNGTLTYQKVRYEPKSFALRRPDGNGGWIWDLEGISPLLYNLPQVLTASDVIYVEGEKDVETARRLSLVATTSGSSSSWRKEFAANFSGLNVSIIVDADDAGRKHGRQVSADLVCRAASVRSLELPGAKDLSDWVEQGGTREKLMELITIAPEVTAAASLSMSSPSNAEKTKGSQVDRLIAAATREGVDLFRNSDGEPFATVPVNNHFETWSVSSQGFRQWLTFQFFLEEHKAPSPPALQNALHTIAAMARFEGEEQSIFLRVASHNGCIYLDLVNPQWQVVEISSSGWRVMDISPVRFIRRRGMRALPTPKSGGNLATLRKFINVRTDSDWILIVSWLLAAMRPSRPYPVLLLNGAQGSAKSTTARVLRSLIDPNAAPIRSEPREPRDLMIAATNGWLIVLDNLSRISSWLSDALCRLATGGGFGTRQLFTDSEEMLFEAMRPMILTGIEELATRSDLLDRCLMVSLPTICEVKRRAEQDFWQDFEQERPAILGALLDAVSTAIRNLPTIKLTGLPRMADFVMWASAAEESFSQRGAFAGAYRSSQADANQIALDSSPLTPAIDDLLHNRDEFHGTCSDLLMLLSARSEEKLKNQDWPKSPQGLSNILRRLMPNLQAAGIVLELTRGPAPKRTRLVLLKKTRKISSTSSISSNLSSFQQRNGTTMDDVSPVAKNSSSITDTSNVTDMDNMDDHGRSFRNLLTHNPEKEPSSR
jgi:hypothetical protein